MKKIIISLFFTLIIFSGTTRPSFAGAGGIVFDPSNLGQMLKEFPVELKNLASTVSTELTSKTGAIQQTLSTLNQTVFRPAQDALTLYTTLSSSEKIKNLVLGGVGGQTSLLIQNPERYIKQKGVESLKLNVGHISQADGIYSNSILDSVVQSARERSDTAGTLASLSRSSLPKTIQNDICEDSKLENLAMGYVTDADGNYDLVALRDKKAELETSLCNGDPNDPNNKGLAEALTVLGQETNAGGWDKLLAKTSGENSFTKERRALSLIEKERETKEAAKNLDYSLGKGVISKTACLVKIPNEVTGGEDCIESVIEQTGDQLNTALSDAIKAPLDLIKNSYGTGGFAGAFGGLITNVTSILGSVNSIRSSVNSVTGQLQGITSSAEMLTRGGDASLQITSQGGTSQGPGTTPTQPTTPVNTPQTTGSYVQDLAGNASTKKNLIGSIMNPLKSHLDALIALERSDARYLQEITKYNGYIEGVNTCYRGLINNYPSEILYEVRNRYTNSLLFSETTFSSLNQNSDVIAGLQYYTTKKNESDTLRSTVTSEIASINTTRTLINTTKTTIENSNSTEEILDTFSSYTDTINNNDLPSEISGLTRESDVISYESNVSLAIRDVGDPRGDEPVYGATANGEITIQKNKCASIGAAELAKRKVKRDERAEALLHVNELPSHGGGDR